MDNRSTSDLMNQLKSANRQDIKNIVTEEMDDFPTYISHIMEEKKFAEKKITKRDIFFRADVPAKTGYAILNGEKKTKNRDTLIRLFLAMKMDIKEVQRALTIYGMPVLYPKQTRDAVCILAINKGVKSVSEVNKWLEEEGQEGLFRIHD